MTQLPPDNDPNQKPEDGTTDPSAPAVQSFPQRPAQAWEQPTGQPTSEQPGGAQPSYQQPSYAQPGYGQQGYPVGQQYAPAAPPTNVFAIVGFIAVFFSGIVGVILGHIALSKIKRTGEGGRGLALAATIIGYVRIGLSILGTILFFVFMGVFGAFGSAYNSSYDSGTYDHGDSEFHNGEVGPGDGMIEEWDPRFTDMPWIGSENEAVCTALLAPEVSVFDDPATYYGELLAVSDDAEFSQVVSDMLTFAEMEGQLTMDQLKQRADAQQQWAESSSQLAEVCMNEGSSER
ncbi:DUF4190 domain-containing protein [Leucobacter sp. NPDC015123]|uniref:DUF4190 domain-containing protein n=1 Tax=Leucobacter sp. NPDC015123 TaxID=3364129 RepID=UPI0036F47603